MHTTKCHSTAADGYLACIATGLETVKDKMSYYDNVYALSAFRLSAKCHKQHPVCTKHCRAISLKRFFAVQTS